MRDLGEGQFGKVMLMKALVSIHEPDHGGPHKVCKSTIVPMKVLFRDDKYKSETVDILDKLAVDVC